jgi:hypothetical protein
MQSQYLELKALLKTSYAQPRRNPSLLGRALFDAPNDISYALRTGRVRERLPAKRSLLGKAIIPLGLAGLLATQLYPQMIPTDLQ